MAPKLGKTTGMDCNALDSPESIPGVFIEAWNNQAPDTLAAIIDEDREYVTEWRD